MNRRSVNLPVLAAFLCLVSLGYANEPVMDGVFGLAPMPESAALAVWVPLEDGESVEGVRWYNNECAKQSLGRGEVS